MTSSISTSNQNFTIFKIGADFPKPFTCKLEGLRILIVFKNDEIARIKISSKHIITIHVKNCETANQRKLQKGEQRWENNF